jgi:hypothetical protein
MSATDNKKDSNNPVTETANGVVIFKVTENMSKAGVKEFCP